METPKNSKQLKQLILLKEAERKSDRGNMEDQLRKTRDSLMPVNLIKIALQKANASQEFKAEAIKLMVGYVTGFVVKRIFKKKTTEQQAEQQEEQADLKIENILGNILVKNADDIKNIGSILIKKMFTRHSVTKEINE